MSINVALKVTAGAVALAAFGFAGSAMALPPTGQVNNQTYGVGINIIVADEVSVWSDDLNLNLLLNGADGNNFAGVQSSIKILNNTSASVTAQVDGALPAPLIPGGGVLFYLFKNTTVLAAQAALETDAYNPAGALVWDSSTVGTPQVLYTSAGLGINTTALNPAITYAAASPGELPLAADFDVVVTYTIAAGP